MSDAGKGSRDPDRAGSDETSRLVEAVTEDSVRRDERAREAAPPPSGNLVLRSVLLIALAVLLTFSLVLSGTDGRRGDAIDGPVPGIVGTWITADRRYAGRFLTISADEVRIGTGEAVEGGALLGVRRWVDEERTFYILEYATPGGPQELVVRTDGDDGLRLRNPPEVRWTRR